MYHLIVFLPLLGSAIAGLLGRYVGTKGAQVVTSSFLVISAILSIVAFAEVGFMGHDTKVHLMTWISSGGFEVDWALRIDTLTAVMLVVVTVVSALVHIYSVGYMSHDPHNPRFFSYLSLFTFCMLMLVTSDNFLQLFFGWEGVGLSSYLLIGFWYKKPSANAAAIKAFVVNRVGDFGFALGILAIFLVFQTVSYDTVFKLAPDFVGAKFTFLSWQPDVLTTICILLFIGAMGKSAQIGLHTWLPDAMEGPTPVSALIHAATMVTAGVFMVARCSPLFELSQTALNVVAIVGATTAFMAATIGLVQNDIKRVIAYSTCSQLGYMFFALGVSAYGAAIFHLFTHAFFKALLFLGSGSVIHAMSDEQDMRKMGGIYTFIPMTYILMWIGSLSLAGFPIVTSGYYSKDAIIESAYAAHTDIGQYAFVMGVVVAALTAFYSLRLLFMTFHGKTRAEEHVLKHVHESPGVMLVPLWILAIGAVAAGYFLSTYFIGEHHAAFWGNALFTAETHTAMEEAEHVPLYIKLMPLGAAFLGGYIAYVMYIRRPDIAPSLAKTHEGLYKFLLNKWYFDELYDFLFVNPAKRLGRFLWKFGDGRIIDGLGPDGISSLVAKLAARARQLQSGYVYHYAFAMLLGIAVMTTWYVVMMAKG